MADDILLAEDGDTFITEAGTDFLVAESSSGDGLAQDVSFLSNSTKVGTSSSNIRCDEIDKNVGIKLRRIK